MRRKSLSGKLSITILIILFFFQSAFSEEKNSDYSPAKITGFTKYLIKQKQYYRASVELERLNSYYPDVLNPDVYSVTRLYLLHNATRHDILTETVKPRKLAAPGHIIVFDSAVFINRLDIASECIEHFTTSEFYTANTAVMNPLLFRREFVLSLLAGRQNDAALVMKKVQRDEFRLYNELLQYYTETEKNRKNPWLALSMGLVPGMGYVYAGSQRTGIVALAVISVTVISSVFAFRTGNSSTGLVLGSIGGFFYAGNILGGYLEARKYNNADRERMKYRMMRQFPMQRDVEMIYDRYGLGNE